MGFGFRRRKNDPEEPEIGIEEVVTPDVEFEEGPVNGISVLSYFEEYPNKHLREEFRELANMTITPAPLLGIADGPDIAEILNLLEVQRLHYKAVPEAIKGDTYMMFDLFVAVAKPMISVQKYGRLLQAETRFKFEQELPSWFLTMLMQKQEEAMRAQQGQAPVQGPYTQPEV